MLSFLPGPFVGLIAAMLYFLNIVAAAICVFSLVFLKIIPFRSWRKFINTLIDKMPSLWIKGNDCIKRFTSKTQFDIRLPNSLSMKKIYLVTSNHQAWEDIIILFSVFNLKIPMIKFFWKKQLLWQAPVVGILCWIYDFPAMHRHTKEQLKKHPEWKGKDFEATRKACEKFKIRPASLMIFAEGTRFTKTKHQRQQSPYHHLLKPKAGGLAYGLQCMGNLIDTMLDVTIIYPPQEKGFWKFCCGKTKKIIVNVNEIPITKDLRGDYEKDPTYRAHFQRFINGVWTQKDALLNQ